MSTVEYTAPPPARRLRIRQRVLMLAGAIVVYLFACLWCLCARFLTTPPPADKE